MQNLLQDQDILTFIRRNEEIITNHFDVPLATNPNHFILQLSNEAEEKKSQLYDSYKIPRVFASTAKECQFCAKKRSIKKYLKVALYDDVMGTMNVAVLTKFCSSCKVTCYPGFSENYGSKVRIFDENWRSSIIFLATYRTAFAVDFLERSVCLKQTCHTTFMGRSTAYNIQHKYQNDVGKKVGQEGISRCLL